MADDRVFLWQSVDDGVKEMDVVGVGPCRFLANVIIENITGLQVGNDKFIIGLRPSPVFPFHSYGLRRIDDDLFSIRLNDLESDVNLDVFTFGIVRSVR